MKQIALVLKRRQCAGPQDKIDIRCRPLQLPEHVEADVSALAVGDALTIADLPVIEDVDYMGEPKQVIVSVNPTVAAEPTEDEVESCCRRSSCDQGQR